MTGERNASIKKYSLNVTVETKPFGVTWYAIHCVQCGRGIVRTTPRSLGEFVENHIGLHTREAQEERNET